MSPRRSASPRPFPRPFPRHGPKRLGELREQIRALEGWGAGAAGTAGKTAAILSLGIPDIDCRLPWGGLPRGALHEIFAADVDDAGAATGFCAALAAMLLKNGRGSVLWCEGSRALDAGGLYAPGLARFRLPPERLIAVRAARDADVLWAMEEGLRAGRLAAVIGEIDGISLTASRRLQLAAEQGGVAALLLRPQSPAPAPSAALTRWRIGARPNAGQQTDPEPGLGAAGWRAEMFRCRGGGGHAWEVEWRDETGGFAMAAAFRDRSAVPRASRMAG
jgi:protein ImuA